MLNLHGGCMAGNLRWLISPIGSLRWLQLVYSPFCLGIVWPLSHVVQDENGSQTNMSCDFQLEMCLFKIPNMYSIQIWEGNINLILCFFLDDMFMSLFFTDLDTPSLAQWHSQLLEKLCETMLGQSLRGVQITRPSSTFTPWKINGWNLKLTYCNWKGNSSSIHLHLGVPC